jgi:YD repeat-containing protein
MEKYQILFLLFVFSFVACNKTSDFITPTNDGKLLLNKIMVDGELYKEFFYDGNEKMIKMNEYYNDSLINSETYQYNSDGKLIKRIHDGFVASYDYNENGLLISYTNYYSKTNHKWKEEYQYNSSDLIQNGLTFFNDEKRGYIEYKYDIKNNTIERKEFENVDNFLVSEYRLQFDDYKNPCLLNFPLDVIQKNNIKKYYYYLAVMSYPPPEYESIYEYNSNGLPVTENRTYLTGKKNIYEYIYKQLE